MSVVPKNSKKVSVRSGKRDKGRCLVDDKCEVKCNPPIVISDEVALVYPDELPPLEEEPVEIPVVPVEIPDESSCVSPILETVLEEVADEVIPVLARVVSACGTKIFNQVTKRWVKIGGKAAAKAGL